MSAAIPARPRPPPVQAATRRRRGAAVLARRGSPPHSLRRLHRRGPAPARAGALFYQGHWSYVGLEAEIPKPGDFKRTAVGERSVIRCATRMDRCAWWRTSARIAACSSAGAPRQPQRVLSARITNGTTTRRQPDRRAVPARRQAGRQVNGGMPPDFKPEEHGLTRWRWPAATAWCSRHSTMRSSRWRTTWDPTSRITSTASSMAASW